MYGRHGGEEGVVRCVDRCVPLALSVKQVTPEDLLCSWGRLLGAPRWPKGEGLQEEGTCVYVCLSHFIVETKVKKRRDTKGKFKRIGKDKKQISLTLLLGVYMNSVFIQDIIFHKATNIYGEFVTGQVLCGMWFILIDLLSPHSTLLIAHAHHF